MPDGALTQTSTGKTNLPLVRLQLLLPFLNALDRLRIDTNALLGRHGIARESIADANLFISSNIIHRFLSALPAGYQSVQTVGGDNRGMTIRFPSLWLTRPVNRSGLVSPATAAIKKNLPPGSFLEALWLTLAPRLGSDDLTVDHVAKLPGLSRQTLQRRLKASGTSLTQELVKMKWQHAIEELLETDNPVAKIGEALGFHSPASFTRAFRSWTGQSPREYRKAHESSTS